MKIFDNVISFLKVKYNLDSNKQVAEFLNIDYGTFRNSVSVDRVPLATLVSLAAKDGIDLNLLLLGKKKNEALLEAIAIGDESEINDIIKQYTLQKIFSGKISFYQKVADLFGFKIKRVILFFYQILLQIQKNENEKIEDGMYKQFLLHKIKNIDLFALSNLLDFTFTILEKQELIKIVQELEEQECKIILESCSDLIEVLKKSLDITQKLIY